MVQNLHLMKFDDEITQRMPVVLLFPEEREAPPSRRDLELTLQPVQEAFELMRRRDEDSTRPLRIRY